MSQENLEIVRRAIEGFNCREMWLEHLDPKVEWIEDPRYPDAQTYRGKDGVKRSIEKWWDTWASLAMRVEEMVDADDRVVIGGVWEFHDGMIVRVRVLGGRNEALEAAGLRE